MPRSRPSRTNPEALRELRERLQATQAAAEKLAEEASRGGRDRRPPPNGWDVPRRAGEANDELDAMVRMLASLRDVLPDELRAQLAELVRQLLVFIRAVLDWWIERMEAADGPGAADGDARDGGVEDIPIA
jgi:hypothetical protein